MRAGVRERGAGRRVRVFWAGLGGCGDGTVVTARGRLAVTEMATENAPSLLGSAVPGRRGRELLRAGAGGLGDPSPAEALGGGHCQPCPESLRP